MDFYGHYNKQINNKIMLGLRTYYKRKKLEIDIEVLKYRTKMNKEIQELALECAKQRGEYEHDWHSKQEQLNTEIAKIEASKESMTKEVENLKEIIKEKDADILRLNNICLEFAKTKISIQK